MHDPHRKVPGKSPGGPAAPANDDALFGKTLVREGVLTPEQLQSALQTQKDLRAGGVTVRLGEVLVKTNVLSPERVKEFLQLVGKQLLYCPKCHKHFNVRNWTPDRDVFCPTCSISLVPPPSDRTIDAHGSQVLPSIGSAGEAKDPAGKPFGPYRLLEELGHGGMGVVWKAWDTRLKRVVALKQILPGEKVDQTTVERFVREAQLAAKLRHPNIVGVHDVGEQDGARYFTTDYIVAQSLDKLVKKGVAVRQALEWAKAAAEALAYAHEQGVVHRDIKPANFLVDGKNQIFVMDFGLAAEVDLRQQAGARRARLTMAGQVLGTPQYMSPEQAKGETDTLGPASDQFSLGVVLYEMLTGRVPFKGSTVWDLLRAIGTADPVPPTQLNRRIHRDVETICLKALEKNPERRYATIGDLAADIGRYLGGEPISARPLTGAQRLMRKVARHRAIVIPSAAAVLFGIAFGAWALAASVQKKNAISGALVRAESAEGLAKTASSDTDLERALTDARDAFTAALALDAENRSAKSGLARVQDRLTALQASREKSIADAQTRATTEAGQRKAQEEAGELLELGRKGLDEAVRYLYDKNANYEELVRKVEVGQKLIEQAIEKAPNLALAHHLLGRCWNLRGWEDKAEACWRKAIEFRPEFGPPHHELGRVLMVRSYLLLLGTNQEREQNRPEAERCAAEAVRELEAARKGVGFDDPVQRAVADATKALAAGDRDSVRSQTLDKIKEFGRQSGVEDLHWLAGGAAHYGSAEQMTSYDQAIELRPTHVLALHSRGNARLAKGDLDGAISDCTEALEINPRFAMAFLDRAVARQGKGDLDGAIQDCTAALRINSHFALAFFDRGAARKLKGDHDGAISDYTEALKINPDFAEALFNRGNAHQDRSDLEEAINDYTNALRINPRYAGAFNNRGTTRKANGDLDGAIEDYTNALKITPLDDTVICNRGLARDAKGDFEGAIQDYTEALKINPRSEVAFCGRGIARQAKGDLDAAIEDYTQALKLNPRDAGTLVNRGNARRAKGDLEGANRDYADAFGIDPGDANTLVARGNGRQAIGDLDGAIRDFTAALSINPRHAEAFSNRGVARRAKGDLDGAIEDFTETLKIKPNEARALMNRGAARKEKGDLRGAIEDTTEALRISPRLTAALSNRGAMRLELGDLDGAIEDCTQCLKIDPRDADALCNRGAARKTKGDFDGAIADCTEALKINPRYTTSLVNRGAARLAKGELDLAIQDLSEALKIEPRSALAFLNRGGARLAKGDFDGAIKDSSEAIEIDSGMPEAFCNRGTARLNKRDLDGAMHDFTEALKINPSLPEALYNRGLARQDKGDLNGAIDDYVKALEFAPPSAPYRKQIEEDLRAARAAKGNPK